MTDLHADITDIAGGRRDGIASMTSTVLRPANSRPGTIAPVVPHTVKIVDGVFTMTGLDPGPAALEIRMGSWVQSWDVTIPESVEPITFKTLLESYVEYEPGTVSEVRQLADQATASAGRAEDAADRAEDAEQYVQGVVDDGAATVRAQVQQDVESAAADAAALVSDQLAAAVAGDRAAVEVARDESLDLAAVTVASAEFVDQRATEVGVNADAVAAHRAAIDTARTEVDAAAGRAETASDAAAAAKVDADSARDDAETAAAEVVIAVSARTSLSGAESLPAALVAGPTYLKRILTGDSTLTIPAGTAGKVYTVTIDIKQDATGGRQLTVAGVKWPEVAPVLRPGAGAHDVIHVMWNGEEWLGLVGGQGFVFVSGGGA